MLRRAVVLIASFAPVAAFAQAAPASAPSGRQQVFISPSGEPFRAPMDAPYPVVRWFEGADANHDGALTRDEFVADAMRFFDTLDVDHNGVIDGFEVTDYERKVAPEILRQLDLGQDPDSPDGPIGGQSAVGSNIRKGGPQIYNQARTGAGQYGLLNEAQPVMGGDADFNRRISRDEAVKVAKSRFAELDVDGDGKLALADLPLTPVQALANRSAKVRSPGR